MSVRDLIDELREKKISLRLSHGRLKVVDPNKVLDEALIERLKIHRDDLIKSLSLSKNFTPSDFPNASDSVGQSFIDDLQARYPSMDNLYIATPMQKGMIYHGILDGSGSGYTVQLTGELHGVLDEARMQFAWDSVIARHEVFRTCFVGLEHKDIHQLVLERISMPIMSLDWTAIPEERLDIELRKLRLDDKNNGFNFAIPPLMRFTLVRIDSDRYYFLWSHHHAILDGWCMGAIIREVLAIYEHPREALEHLPRSESYSNFIGWLKSRDSDAARNYWRDQLVGFEGASHLTFNSDATGDGCRGILAQELTLDEVVATELDAMARQARCTLNVVLQAAWSYLLHRYTGMCDIVFGATMSGRPSELPGVEAMIGLFINTVPIRVQFHPDQSLGSLLDTLNRDHAQREEYSFLPLTEIQSLSPNVIAGSLFETKLGFANYPDKYYLSDAQQEDSSLRLSSVHGQSYSNYGLDIIVSRYPSFTISLKYDSELYSSSAMGRLLQHLENILKGIAQADLKCPLRDIPMLSDRERHDLIHNWNQTNAVYPSDVCIHQLFEEQCKKSPEATAIVHQSRTLTFQEVNAAADTLAQKIAAVGLVPESPVGLWIDRSPEMVIGLLAILKAGGAYVPLDPDNPVDRLTMIAVDCGMTICLTSEALKNGSNCWLPQTVALISIDASLEAHYVNIAAPKGCSPSQLATIIYTSGSTGRPKGVMLEHRSIVNRLFWGWSTIPLADDEILCQKTTIGFGDSICETLTGLLQGRPLHIVDKSTLLEPGGLDDFIDRHRISRLVAVPSLLSSMTASHSSTQGTNTLRICVSSGEELMWKTVEDMRRRFLDCRFFNYYGSTETTADACSHEIGKRGQQTKVLIGHPISNVTCYVLSPERKLMPLECIGELYVGGQCLARGYWNQLEQTAERFIDDTFAPGGRLFKTGDLVRRLEDGALEFIGRADDQVKVRGIRIEPAEIERVLEEHPSVEKTVVKALNRGSGSELVAYILLAEHVRARVAGEVFGRVNLRETLQQAVAKQLPSYMMPRAFVYLDELPMTPSGKLDVRSLPEPNPTDFHNPDRRKPRDAVEVRLCEIWQQVLGIDEVGINENFFDLGGHSLLATRLVSILRTEFNDDFPLQAIYEHPTIDALASEIRSIDRQLEADNPKNTPSSLEPILPLRANGERLPIFCLHPGSGLSLCYGRLADQLPRDRPVYGLQPACLTSGASFPDTMEDLANENVRLIRSVQPHGPYHLLGFSFGGLAAHAIACALLDIGETVGTLAILDASPGSSPSQSQLTDEELIRGILLSVRCDPDELFPETLPTFDDMMNLLRDRNVIPPGFEDVDKERLTAMRRGMFAVQAAFRPRIFHGDVLLFEASQEHSPNELSGRWAPYVSGKIDSHTVESDHYGMIDHEPMVLIGAALKRHLQETKQ